ncbi:MAG: hypothetical protein ABI868_12290 [Acidobacteriota bacterium]
MGRRILFITMLLAGAAGVTACDEQLAPIAGPTPNLEPTFASIQREIFETTDSAGRVACTGCHTSVGRIPAGGLTLTHDAAYDNLVGVPSRLKTGATRVIAGDPENSYIIQKLEGRSDIVGLRMPFSGQPFLGAGQILILKRWIELGAPRN